MNMETSTSASVNISTEHIYTGTYNNALGAFVDSEQDTREERRANPTPWGTPWGTPVVEPVEVVGWVTSPSLVAHWKPNERYLRKGICKDCNNSCPSRKKITECPFYDEKVIEVDISHITTLFGCSIFTYPFDSPNQFRLTVDGRTEQYDLSGSGSILNQLRDGVDDYETQYGEAPGAVYIHPETHTALMEEIVGRLDGTR